jgi:hypothetical protein
MTTAPLSANRLPCRPDCREPLHFVREDPWLSVHLGPRLLAQVMVLNFATLLPLLRR